MLKNPIDYGTDLNALGIKAFIIITKNGIPVMERIYDNNLDIGTDTFLTAGFLSAFARFADEQVSGLLSDIGLHTYRLFFDYSEHLLFLLVYDEIKLNKLPVGKFLMLFKGTMSEIKSLIREFFLEDSNESIMEMLEDPKALENLSTALGTVGMQCDRIIIKSHKMLMELLDT